MVWYQIKLGVCMKERDKDVQTLYLWVCFMNTHRSAVPCKEKVWNKKVPYMHLNRLRSIAGSLFHHHNLGFFFEQGYAWFWIKKQASFSILLVSWLSKLCVYSIAEPDCLLLIKSAQFCRWFWPTCKASSTVCLLHLIEDCDFRRCLPFLCATWVTWKKPWASCLRVRLEDTIPGSAPVLSVADRDSLLPHLCSHLVQINNLHKRKTHEDQSSTWIKSLTVSSGCFHNGALGAHQTLFDISIHFVCWNESCFPSK